MSELEQALIGNSAAAPPSHILEGLTDTLVHHELTGVTHTIYGELWHIAFWQQVSLDWIDRVETPIPAHASDGFPSAAQRAGETWQSLTFRFFSTLEQAASASRDGQRLPTTIRCPSPPGKPVRIMTVADQLISLAAHNAYHFGRIVMLRQMLGAWPPTSGGFTW